MNFDNLFKKLWFLLFSFYLIYSRNKEEIIILKKKVNIFLEINRPIHEFHLL